MLKNFKVDKNRSKLYVTCEYYQMDITSVVDAARIANPDLFVDGGQLLPSWTKFGADPVRAKGFFINMLQAVFLDGGDDSSLNIDLQTRRNLKKEGLKVAMLWLPHGMTNDALGHAAVIAGEALAGYDILAIYGDNMTNASAEKKCEEFVETARKKGQNVLFISKGMAARSFSIPEITEIHLAYDRGESGATVQKIARGLTAHTVGKIARICSWSFDPNRDDKFDATFILTAMNYNKKKNLKNMRRSLEDVLGTVKIFKTTQNGRVEFKIDDYLLQLSNRDSIDRVAGKICPLDTFSDEEIAALANGHIDMQRLPVAQKTETGKTRLKVAASTRNKNMTSADEKLMQKAREMIATISKNIDVFYYQSGTSLENSFALLDNEPNSQADIAEEFNLNYEFIKHIVLRKISPDVLELKVLAEEMKRDQLDRKFAK